MSSCNKVRARSFANSPDGWRHLLDWLITQRVRRVHACLESTGRYSLGIAGALIDAVAQSLADVTISHFTSQLSAVDEAITQTIDHYSVLRRKRDLLLSISGVGETLAGVVLAELPGPDVLHSSAEVVA